MEAFNALLSGVILPAGLTLLALFFLVYLRGRPFRGFFRALGGLKNSDPASPSPFKSVSVALAGTLGVGNIVGVADAIVKGGPGVLFWMAVSSFAAMTVKYAEVALCLHFRGRSSKRPLFAPQKDPSAEFGTTELAAQSSAIAPPGRARRTFRAQNGGAPEGSYGSIDYLPRGADAVFCVFLTLCAFSVGGAMQTEAASGAGRLLHPALFYLTAPCAALLLTPVIFQGKRRLFDLLSRAVPVMTALYAVLCLLVIVRRGASLPGVLKNVFSAAFTPVAALRGGGAGALAALRFGVIRGLLSNEAGCGTAPIAHASSGARSGASQGALGVLEVAVDTLLLCTLTGLALLSSGVPLSPSSLPIAHVAAAFESVLGRAAFPTLYLLVLSFACGTVVCWSFYLDTALSFLLKNKTAVTVFKALFLVFAAFGPFVSQNLLWQTSDLSVGMMALINCAALFLHRRSIREECAAGTPLCARVRASAADTAKTEKQLLKNRRKPPTHNNNEEKRA